MIDSVSRPPRRGRAWLVVALLLLAAGGFLLWQFAAQWGAPNPHRVEMYQRILDNLRASCVPPKPTLEGYCRDQAALLLEYPECDADCAALVRAIRHEPAR